ncbi:hypothetical protein FACS1894166_06370 [Bacilli bacterium]|nr:hypothetical protein FACS1894166_06370 [Bacilli bacterium]
MGSVPMAIASLDQQQVLVQDYSTGDILYDLGKTECIGIPEYWSDADPATATIPFTEKFPTNLTLTDYLN